MRGVTADTNRETGVIKVANVERIRWAHSQDGMSIRAVARAFRVMWPYCTRQVEGWANVLG